MATTSSLAPADREDPLLPFLPLRDYERMGLARWTHRHYEFTPDAADIAMKFFRLRDRFRHDHGYVLATDESMHALTALLAPRGRVLDAGCGTGYLTRELRRRGVDAQGADLRALAQGGTGDSALVHADATSLLPGDYGAVLLTWPPYDEPFAHRVAMAMRPGQLLVCEGEAAGGCTADDGFFDYMADADADTWELLSDATAQLNHQHVALPLVHDCWTVWRRVGRG